MHDARTPALVNVAAASVNALANVALTLVLGLGIGGLALGHAASYLFGTLVLSGILRGRLRRLDGRRIARTVGKVIPAGLLSAGAALGVVIGLRETIGEAAAPERLLQVVAAVVVGLLAFVSSALIFRIEEVDDLRKAVQRRQR
jgi:putative peptidoglycan lipid II flippase